MGTALSRQARKTYLLEFVQDRQVQVSEGEALLQASLDAGSLGFFGEQ
jgi:hypothetical protein